MFHWQTTRISFFRGEYHLFLLLTIFAQLGATAQSACGQQAKLEWHDADKVDRLELEDLYESYLSRIHALERFECHYTIDRSDDVGANGARIEAYSQLIADDGKGSGRFISRREDIDRQLGTITLSGNSSSQTSFFIDMLKKNEKVYRWGGDQSYELTKTTLDSQRSSGF